jgi:hypothetical protein
VKYEIKQNVNITLIYKYNQLTELWIMETIRGDEVAARWSHTIHIYTHTHTVQIHENKQNKVVSLYHCYCVMWELTCLSIVFWSSRTRATSESGSMAPLDRRCVQKTRHNVTLITTTPGTHKNKEKNLKWTNNYYCVINKSASKFSNIAITNNVWNWMPFHILARIWK